MIFVSPIYITEKKGRKFCLCLNEKLCHTNYEVESNEIYGTY